MPLVKQGNGKSVSSKFNHPSQLHVDYQTRMFTYSRIYNRLSSMNIPKNSHIYTTMLCALTDSKQWETAKAVVVDICNSKSFVTEGTFAAILTMFEKSGDSQEAINFYVQALISGKFKVDIVSLNIALSSCRSKGDLITALRLLLSAEAYKIIPDAISISNVILLCVDIRECTIAREIFDATSSSYPLTVCKQILERYVQSDVGYSSRLRIPDNSTISSIKRDAGVYHAIISSCERQGNWKECVNLLVDMVSKNLDSCRPEARSFSLVIQACKDQKQYDVAWKCFNLMDELGKPT
jgi:pentatricopeptide repeat protein